MKKPFGGAITKFLKDEAPKDIRKTIEHSSKNDMVDPSYPYKERMDKKEYEKELYRLQIELVKMQASMRENGDRIAVIFEGRDAAGKGGTINVFAQHLNPRNTHIVALTKPSEEEQGQWYFQRYIKHLPTKGEISLFDRSWYNRGVVEKVFGFCTDSQRSLFFDQVGGFEKALVDDGLKLFKIWLTVGQAEQLRRFLAREDDPLKQWKLSDIDVEGLKRWNEYTKAIAETLAVTHTRHAPWTVVRADDKRRARLNVIKSVLLGLDYKNKDMKLLDTVDTDIVGTGTEILL